MIEFNMGLALNIHQNTKRGVFRTAAAAATSCCRLHVVAG